MNIFIGIVLYVNLVELSKLKGYWNKNTLTKNLKNIFKFLFFYFSNGIFDTNRIWTLSFDPNINLHLLFAKYSLVALNTLPLISNFFIKKRILNIPFTLFPSQVSLATLTIFLNNFRISCLINGKIYILIDILCYSVLFLHFINDFIILKGFTYENLFFIILNILNSILIYYLDLYSNKEGISKDI
jgi:hypothetical protein